MRAVMRSTSALPLSARRSACHDWLACKVAIASSRCAATRAVAQRGEQPCFQQTAAHAGHAGVEQRKQRGRVLAAQGLRQLQVAPRGGWQVDQRIALLHDDALQMRQHPALRVLGIGHQRTGGGVGLRQGFGVPARQAGGFEEFQQLALPQSGVKLPFGAAGEVEL